MRNNPQWTVREVVPSDEPFWAGLFRGYRRHYEMPDDEAVVELAWRWLHDPTHDLQGYVVVDEGHRVGGIAHVRRFPQPVRGTTGLFLDDLFVDPALRGHGLGRTLLAFVRDYAARHDLGVVRWITAEDNRAARALYDSEATATRWVTYDMTPRRE